MKTLKGHGQDAIYTAGTIRTRTRHKRGGERRNFIKVSDDPNTWILLSRFNWESTHGPIPPRMGIHHIDGNTLNDSLANLELVSKAAHLEIHMPEFREKALGHFTETRRKLRWTTKSTTKRTGRPPTWTDSQLSNALAAYRKGGTTKAEIERRFGLPPRTLTKKL